LLGPGATGIVGAAGGAMHAAKDMVAANAAAICGWKRFMVLPPDGKLSLRRVLLCRQVLKDLNAKAAHAWSIIRARRIVQLLPSSWQPLIRSLTDTINNDHMHGLPED